MILFLYFCCSSFWVWVWLWWARFWSWKYNNHGRYVCSAYYCLDSFCYDQYFRYFFGQKGWTTNFVAHLFEFECSCGDNTFGVENTIIMVGMPSVLFILQLTDSTNFMLLSMDKSDLLGKVGINVNIQLHKCVWFRE